MCASLFGAPPSIVACVRFEPACCLHPPATEWTLLLLACVWFCLVFLRPFGPECTRVLVAYVFAWVHPLACCLRPFCLAILRRFGPECARLRLASVWTRVCLLASVLALPFFVRFACVRLGMTAPACCLLASVFLAPVFSLAFCVRFGPECTCFLPVPVLVAALALVPWWGPLKKPTLHPTDPPYPFNLPAF